MRWLSVARETTAAKCVDSRHKLLSVNHFHSTRECHWGPAGVTSPQQRSKTPLQAIQRALHSAAALPQHMRVAHHPGAGCMLETRTWRSLLVRDSKRVSRALCSNWRRPQDRPRSDRQVEGASRTAFVTHSSRICACHGCTFLPNLGTVSQVKLRPWADVVGPDRMGRGKAV